jgi:ATP-dependent exoDNAse (exonuclease V) beta subunit
MLIKKSLRASGRLIAVGDKKQAIYGFRAADVKSLDLIRSDFDCVELPLSISYRCPTKVIELAKEFSPDIEASSTAAEGMIVTTNLSYDIAL